MIDLENYQLAIQWLERGIAEQTRKPDDETVRDSITLSFEVTYNLSERILRQALSEFAGDPSIVFVSSRELMRYAVDEGLPLSSAENWLRYGIALEQVNKTQGGAFSESLVSLLPNYITELQAFSQRLENRLVSFA